MRIRFRLLVALGAALALVWRGLRWRVPGDTRSSRNGERPEARVRLRPAASMTRAELYEEAKRLGISGRSQMSKAELIRAIERARR